MNSTTSEVQPYGVWHVELTGPAADMLDWFSTEIVGFNRDAFDYANLVAKAADKVESQYADVLARHPDLMLEFTVKPTTNKYRNPDGSQAFFVTVYSIGRGYGGPEEGGWWFDCGTVVEHRMCRSYAEAVEVQDRLRKTEYPDTGQRYSIMPGSDDYGLRIGIEPGADYPTEVPHYE